MNNRDQIIQAYEAMRMYGGGFMRNLAEALVTADNKNAQIILTSWSEEINHLIRLKEGK